MNSDRTPNPREELETRITALLLGELPATETSALRDEIARDPELAKLEERLKVAIKLVNEASASPAEKAEVQTPLLRLSEDKRQQLLGHFKTVRPKEFEKTGWREGRSKRLVGVAAVVALSGVIAALLVPVSHSFRSLQLSSDVRSDDAATFLREKPLASPAGSRQAPGDMQGAATSPVQHLAKSEPSSPAPVALEAALKSPPARTTIFLPHGEEKQPELALNEPKVTFGAAAPEVSPGFSFQSPAANEQAVSADSAFDLRRESDDQRKEQSGENRSTLYRLAVPESAANPHESVAAGTFSLQQAPPQTAAKDSAQPAQTTGPVNGWATDSTGNAAASAPAISVGQGFVITGESKPGTGTAGNEFSRAGGTGGGGGGGVGGMLAPAVSPPAATPPGSIVLPSGGAVADSTKTRVDTFAAGEPQVQAQTRFSDVSQKDRYALGWSWRTPQTDRSVVQQSQSQNYLAPGENPTALGDVATSTANSDTKVPVLGDVTAQGSLFRGRYEVGQRRLPPIQDGDSLKAFNGVVSGTVSMTNTLEVAESESVVPALVEPLLSTTTPSGGTRRVPVDVKQASNDGPPKSPANLSYAASTESSMPRGTSDTPADSMDIAGNANAQVGAPKIENPPTPMHQSQGNLLVADASAQQPNRSPAAGGADRGAANQPNTPAMLMAGETVQRLEVTRDELQADYLRQKALLDSLTAYKQDPNKITKVMAETGAKDPMLSSLQGQLVEAEKKLRKLEEARSPKNSEAARARSQVEELRRKVNSRADALVLGLDARVSSLRSGLDELSVAVTNARKQDMELAGADQSYRQARMRLEEAQRFEQLLNMKIYSEATDVELPKTAMAEIVDKAVPASEPSPTLWERIAGGAKYQSTARVKVERDPSDISGPASSPKGETFDPYFVQTESDVIRSPVVLGKVAENLNLADAWAKKDGSKKLTTDKTVTLLKKNLELRPVKNTGLLEIGFKSDKPDEAAKVANAIAEAYQIHRQEERKRLTRGGIEGLKLAFAEQKKKVAAAQAEVDRLSAKAQGAQAPQPDAAPARPALPPPVPQPEMLTSENAFSTFSLNVSDVSFKLAQASLEKGMMPEAASIRSEEFINAFDYRDPEPGPGAAMAFAFERARYPFAQNRDVVRFALKTAAQGRQAGRPLNLVVLLDNSGSMERADRVRIIHEALRVLAGQLQAQDTFSVVTFARTARLLADGVPGSQAARVAEDVSGLTPEGGTNLEEAMNLAYATALRHYQANGVNRVVLLTDGAANLGNVEPETLKQKVETNRKQGIALDCFGIGWEGYNDDLLEVLSRNGDGRYGFLNTPEEAATEFVGKLAGALRVAAADVKVQVEFNPKRVTAYRQVGYAKHQLAKEQFRDNTVDAAEIGAAEAGNALYVVEVNPAGEGPLSTVRVRYKVPGTSDYREQEWVAPYSGNAVALDQATSAMRLSASASAFSEWLAASPYATEVTPDRVLGYLRGVAEVYGADTRPKSLEWMVREAKSLEGNQSPAMSAPKAADTDSEQSSPATRWREGLTNGF